MIQDIHLVTLFSKEYILQGMAMLDSFAKHHKNSILHVLALDDFTYLQLNKHISQKAFIVNLKNDLELSKLRSDLMENRSNSETIFTLKSYWIKCVSEKLPLKSKIIYVDADIYFFNKIEFAHSSNWSVLLSKHDFSNLQFEIKSGKYNAGLISFNLDQNSLAAIRWWSSRTIELCDASVKALNYADQKYLEYLPAEFAGVHEFPGKGTNLGLWKFQKKSKLSFGNGEIFFDGSKVNSFHFHGFKVGKYFYKLGLFRYGKPRNLRVLFLRIYLEYLRKIRDLNKLLDAENIDPMTNITRVLTSFIKAASRNPLILFDFWIRKIGKNSFWGG